MVVISIGLSDQVLEEVIIMIVECCGVVVDVVVVGVFVEDGDFVWVVVECVDIFFDLVEGEMLIFQIQVCDFGIEDVLVCYEVLERELVQFLFLLVLLY